MAPKQSARKQSEPPSTPASHHPRIFTDPSNTDDTDTGSLDSQRPRKKVKRQRPSHLQLTTNDMEGNDHLRKNGVPSDISRPIGTPPMASGNTRTVNQVTGPLSTPTQPVRPSVRSLLSNKVNCVLTVTYDGVALGKPQHIEIDWLDKKTYDDVDAASHKRLAEFNRVDPSIHLYRKHGVCKILRHAAYYENDRDDTYQPTPSEQEVESRTMHEETEWAEVPQFLIMRFKSEYRYDEFHLELRWDYSGYVKPTGDDEQYAKAVLNLIDGKMRTNWNDDHYIPRIDLNQILQDNTIARLIRCDKSIAAVVEKSSDPTYPFDTEEFVKRVSDLGTRLLAICIYVELPLICLKLMLDNGKCDVSLPFGAHDVELPKEYSANYRRFMTYQGSFIAHHFERQKGATDGPHRNGESENALPYLEVKPKVVMPIHFDKKKDHVGNGSYGDVYRVTIDPDHHYFDPDKEMHFALKIFRDNGEQTVKDFHRESTMLDELSGLPHDHVVPHLASWTQEGKFYMLFNLADCNLKTYLSENETPLLTKDFVIWLLSQMHGLADGVSHLHNLGAIITQSTIASQLPNVAHRERTCFHHDLKPENILVFRQKHTRYPVLKISDFGSGRIGRLRSGMKGSYATKNPTHGTLEYEGPDWMLDQKTSRPYDIWSLGCIFLEVLLWTSGQERPDDFADDRLRHQDNAREPGRSTKFWCIDKRFKLRHKPIVTAWHKRLKKHCRGRGAFEDVVKTTWGMLKLQPKSRTKAHSVANDFAAMLKSTRRDLRDDPNFFLKDKEDSAEAFRSSKKVAAPLSVISSQRSRSQSVDNRSDQGLHGQYLIPNSPVVQTIKRNHKKKTESVSISIPVSDFDRDWVTQTNMVLPEITVADDNSDESDDSDEMQSEPDLRGPPHPGSPQILLGEGSMAPRGRSREALHTLEEADSLALQREIRNILKEG